MKERTMKWTCRECGMEHEATIEIEDDDGTISLIRPSFECTTARAKPEDGDAQSLPAEREFEP